MYKISVPIMNAYVERNGREETLRELKRFDADRVFLALDCYELDDNKRAKAMTALAENCRFFQSQGFEVGAWIWTFWVKGTKKFRCMRSLAGKDEEEFICPTDESFVEFACDYIADIARCGVSLIMFDDDFRYGFRWTYSGNQSDYGRVLHARGIGACHSQRWEKQVPGCLFAGERGCLPLLCAGCARRSGPRGFDDSHRTLHLYVYLGSGWYGCV